MKRPLLEALEVRPLLGDGAMGTQLMIAGLEQGHCREAWNLTHPERVLAIQRRYVEAGSDCLITNTFGGSRIMLNRHGQATDVRPINEAGVAIAREAFGTKEGYILGDIGPFGGLMEPYGEFTEAEVRDATCCVPTDRCWECQVKLGEVRAARRDALLHSMSTVRPRRPVW